MKPLTVSFAGQHGRGMATCSASYAGDADGFWEQ